MYNETNVKFVGTYVNLIIYLTEIHLLCSTVAAIPRYSNQFHTAHQNRIAWKLLLGSAYFLHIYGEYNTTGGVNRYTLPRFMERTWTEQKWRAKQVFHILFFLLYLIYISGKAFYLYLFANRALAKF